MSRQSAIYVPADKQAATTSITGTVQRYPTPSLKTERDEGEVPPIVHKVLQSPGQPLDEYTRVFMESRFGHDFSKVRVHTDAMAAESARAVNALAYTVGRDVVFREGRYVPRAAEGNKLLAHELAHVVQQAGSDGICSGQRNKKLGLSPIVLERDAEQASCAMETTWGSTVVGSASAPILARQEETPQLSKESTAVINIQETLDTIEQWQMGVAGSVSESNIVLKILAFIPFFFLELLRRAVQLGNLLFGVTELQGAADILSNPDKTTWQKVKAALWALFIMAMDLMMVGGIAEKVGLWISKSLSFLGKVGWIARLGELSTAFIEKAIATAREMLPTFTRLLDWATLSAKALLERLITKVTGSSVWAKLLEWSKTSVRLPSAVEALSEDIFVVMRRALGQEAPQLGTQAGIGSQIIGDVKLAAQARDIAAQQAQGTLPGLSTAEKGVAGEQAARLVSRLQGWKLTAEDLSKIGPNNGIDLLLVKNGRQFGVAAQEVKATTSASARASLLSETEVRAGSPLAQIGVPIGTPVQQASRGFNFDRLVRLAQTGDPEKIAAAKAFLDNLARLEEQLTIVRLKTGTVELYRLDMDPNLLEISNIQEILTMTFGEIKRTYYILIAAEVAPFAVKAGVAAEWGQ